MIGRTMVGWWGILGRSEQEAIRDGYLTFEQEIDRAILMDAKAKVDSLGQMNLFQTLPLPGWKMPLFAHVGGFLFLRRPEGVWKLPCPSEQDQPTVAHLPSMDGKKFVPFSVGMPSRDCGRWHRLSGDPATPEQMDGWGRCPAGVEADELGAALLNPPKIEGGQVIFEAGDGFTRAPVLTYDGSRWIYGQGQDGRRLAFDALDIPWAQQAIDDGSLMLRFTSRFFSPFDAPVSPGDGH